MTAFDPRSVRRLQRKLRSLGKAADRASATAANRAARSTVAEFSRNTRRDVPVKAARLKKLAKVRKATRGRPVAEIRISGAHVPLTDMGARQTKKGVSVRLTKGGGRKVYKRAFVTTMKSGHRGVYRRTTRARLPIEEMFGPSGIGMWRHRERHLARHGMSQLEKELRSAIRRIGQRQ